jgi:hypothetical protein
MNFTWRVSGFVRFVNFANFGIQQRGDNVVIFMAYSVVHCRIAVLVYKVYDRL